MISKSLSGTVRLTFQSGLLEADSGRGLRRGEKPARGNFGSGPAAGGGGSEEELGSGSFARPIVSGGEPVNVCLDLSARDPLDGAVEGRDVLIPALNRIFFGSSAGTTSRISY
jgi:hypothetical protein